MAPWFVIALYDILFSVCINSLSLITALSNLNVHYQLMADGLNNHQLALSLSPKNVLLLFLTTNILYFCILCAAVLTWHMLDSLSLETDVLMPSIWKGSRRVLIGHVYTYTGACTYTYLHIVRLSLLQWGYSYIAPLCPHKHLYFAIS